MFGGMGQAADRLSMTFVSAASMQADNRWMADTKRKLSIVKNVREVTKANMHLNDYQPEITVDPETYEVRADGELLVCEPASELPLAQRYYLF
jgi:urease subunit alpha